MAEIVPFVDMARPGGCCLDEKKMETLLKRSEQKTKHMSKLVDEACASSMQAER